MQLNSHQFENTYQKLGINLDKLGCVMLDLEPVKFIPIGWESFEIYLYHSKNRDRFWIDGWVCNRIPHITLLYGLLENAQNQSENIEAVLKDWDLDTVEIEDIGYFDSPYPDEPYYCIVAHIKRTPELLEGHHRLEFLPHINTFPIYKPHMTVCYIAKVQGETWRDELIQELKEALIGAKLRISGLNLGGDK